MAILRISDGQKGGSGKSTVALCLIDYCVQHGPVLVIDADKTNPDVNRSVENTGLEITRMLADLNSDDGWDDFMGYLEDSASKYQNIIISLPAGETDASVDLGAVKEVMGALNIEVWQYFSINRSRESINQFIKSGTMGYGKIADRRFPVLNGYYGEREKFVRWDTILESKKGKELLGEAREIYLPDLNDAIMDMLREDNQQTFTEVAKNGEMKMFRRSKLNSWLKDVHSAINNAGG